MAPLTGRVHGTTIDLDAAPNRRFDGKRVRVVLELVDDDVRPTPDEQVRAWSAWSAGGPDGPAMDDGEHGGQGLLGLFGHEPEVVDEAMRYVHERRRTR